MAPVSDLHPQLVQIDQQLIQLLERRRQLCNDLRESGSMLTSDEENQIMFQWLEDAADFEMDEVIIEKMNRLTQALCRKMGE
ncbi:MAG: hypothetical protein O2904_02555 [bacterium]|nr:hypothetical protein [bacterium]